MVGPRHEDHIRDAPAARGTARALRRPADPRLAEHISFTEVGPASAPPLVLIPGGPGEVATSAMTGVAAELAETYRCVLVQTRGTSAHPGTTPFSTEDIAEDVQGLLDHLEIESACVAGASLGAMIATHLAAGLGARTKAVVLALGTAGGDPFTHALLHHLAALARTAPAEFAVASGLWGGGVAGFPTWGASVAAARRPGDRTPREGTALRFEAAGDHDARGRLADISAPALVLSAEHDLLMRAELGRRLAAGLADSTYMEISEATHMVVSEDTAGFARRCGDFFRARA